VGDFSQLLLQGRIEGVAQPDCIVVVTDATNLERNCYLATQAIALGLPVVIALSLVDLAEEKGIAVDAAEVVRIADRIFPALPESWRPVLPAELQRQKATMRTSSLGQNPEQAGLAPSEMAR
jgi:hypothetical protein